MDAYFRPWRRGTFDPEKNLKNATLLRTKMEEGGVGFERAPQFSYCFQIELARRDCHAYMRKDATPQRFVNARVSQCFNASYATTKSRNIRPPKMYLTLRAVEFASPRLIMLSSYQFCAFVPRPQHLLCRNSSGYTTGECWTETGGVNKQ